MTRIHPLAALSVAAVLLAPLTHLAAATPAQADDMAGHHASAGASGSARGAMMEPVELRAMHTMRDRMAAAHTPESRQALMAEHLKAMQDGMAMMKGMAPMAGSYASGSRHGMGRTAESHTMEGPADKPSHESMGNKLTDLERGPGSAAEAKSTMASMPHQRRMAMHMDLMQTMMEMMLQRLPGAESTVR
jgi:hypothetical protein